MPVAKNGFQTPSIVASGGNIPSFLTCSKFASSDMNTRRGEQRVTLARTRIPLLRPRPYSTTPGVPASTLVMNYTNGTKTPAGTCVSKETMRLTRPPSLRCSSYSKRQFPSEADFEKFPGSARRLQFPTSYEKSILPCEGRRSRAVEEHYGTSTPQLAKLPQGNDTDIVVMPSPNNELAQKIVSMGTKPPTPYVPRYFGRIMTQTDVSAINFGPTMVIRPPKSSQFDRK